MRQLRVAHIADTHFDETDRLEETVETMEAFLHACNREGVSLIVHAGDWFHRKSTPAERTALAKWLVQASRIASVVGVKGNHDAAGDLAIFNLLSSGYSIDILDRPTVAPESSPILETRDGAVGIIALPWFDKAHLVAQLSAEVEAERTTQLTIEAARRLLLALGAEAQRIRNEHAIPILVGHVLVAGSETSTGQTLIGTTVELSPGDIADVGAEYAALGHIHLTQQWQEGRVCYSGSPRRCNFGEPEAKGFRLVTFEDGRFISNQFIELPARRILLIEEDWTAGDGPIRVSKDQGSISGTLVRWRYRVRPEDLHLVDEDAIRRGLLESGAHEVAIEAVLVHEARIRSEAIVSALTTWDKVVAYLEAKSIVLPDAQLERLRAKLAEIEAGEEVEHAAA